MDKNKIEFHQIGQANKALLFVHGAGSDHSVWDFQIQSLDADFTLASLNLNGHGKSPRRDGKELKTYCEDVQIILNELACPTILIGHSMGGAIAMNVALKQPDHLIGLGLISTGARLKVIDTMLALMDSDFDGAVDFLIGLLFHQSIPDVVQQTRQMMLNNGQAITLRDFETCNRFDLRDQLAQINLPAWICVGEQDQMTPVKFSEYLSGALPKTTLDIISDAGHMVMLEQPETFNSKLEDWIKKTFSSDHTSVEA